MNIGKKNDVMKSAKQIFENDYAEARKSGVLQPSKNQNPINPPLTVIEYAGMENDTAKYFLYYAAIHAELSSLQKQNISNGVACMVVGAGRGRLVDCCIDCLHELNILGSVFVVECNVAANAFLQEKFCMNKNVTVLSPIVIRTEEELRLAVNAESCDETLKVLLENAPVDLFVSELFGSFGDNEFITEILSVCVESFGKKTSISIPCSYSTFICAVFSPTLQKYFEKHTDSAMYILELPKDTVTLSDLVKLYEHSCTSVCECINEKVTLKTTEKSPNCAVTGLAGFFRANLNKDFVIDTTNTETRNTFYWETAFFPLFNIPLKRENEELNVAFCRKSLKQSSDADNIFNIEYPLLNVSYEWCASIKDTKSCFGLHKLVL